MSAIAVVASERDDTSSEIARLAGPVLVLGLLRAGSFVATACWTARLSSLRGASLSALGGAAFATWMLVCLGDLAGLGTHARVAHAAGARDRGALARSARDGVVIALGLGALLAVGAVPLADAFVSAVGFSGPRFADVRAVAHPFVVALFALAAPTFVQVVFEAVFRGIGDTKTPLYVAAAALVANVALEGALMITAHLGLAGAALATALTQTIAALVLFVILVRRGVFAGGASSIAGLRETIRIGLPPALSGIGVGMTYVGLGHALAAFGPAATAGLGIGQRIEAPAYQVCAAFGVAAATLVGQRRGEGSAPDAARAAHRVAIFATIAMVPFALVFALAPASLAELLGGGPEASSYIAATGLALVPMALEIVYENAFAGAASSFAAMAVVLPLTALRVPLAIAAVHLGAGLGAVFAIIAATTIGKGLLLAASFRARFG